MSTTKSDIREWLEEAKEDTSHMIVVCDTYDYDDYPVYVSKSENLKDKIASYNFSNMQKIMEVYSLTGKYSIESQLEEYRAHHLD
jgi:hypothetical protein